MTHHSQAQLIRYGHLPRYDHRLSDRELKQGNNKNESLSGLSEVLTLARGVTYPLLLKIQAGNMLPSSSH